MKIEECLGVTVQLGDIERFLYYDYTKRLDPSKPKRGELNLGVFGAEKEWPFCVELKGVWN